MNILHVSLGNPKHHRGGLNRYCADLMNEQKRAGHSVGILYAGTYGGVTRIKTHGKNEYAVNGALPVAILYGIDDPKRYKKKTSKEIYKKWLRKYTPDVIHVHSFMGIHKEFFWAAAQLKIPMVFTTHDYYACCFRCNLYNWKEQLCDGEFQAEQCQKCNAGAGLGRNTQMLLQSEWYQSIKNWSVIQYLKKKKIKTEKEAEIQKSKEVSNPYRAEAFRELYEYYYQIMEKMTVIHCNSEIAKVFFQKHYPDFSYEIVPISHSGIVRKKHRKKDRHKLQISYFGGMFGYKGYYQLKEAVLALTEETAAEWKLSLYGGSYTDAYKDSRICIKGIFSKQEEEGVWENTDLLIFPSQWPETFGFGVLEALARGIPVICSDLVGAGYLLGELSKDCIYPHENAEALKQCIKRFLEPEYYRGIQEKISDLKLPADMKEHAEEIVELYKRAGAC